MNYRRLIIILFWLCQTAVSNVMSQEAEQPEATKNPTPAVTPKPTLPVVHPQIGHEVSFGDSCKIRLVKKLQNYSFGANQNPDPDIYSPKSVNIHPSGKKFYVNSLEGGKTVVYSLPEAEKLAIISHRIDSGHAPLWAPPSGLFKFRHYSKNLNNFMGKPVESAFSHGGKYLWVPYYRRSFDINAQDPSALAVIDTSSDSIICLMETGVLPKMIMASPDESIMAVTHWGDNTVSLIDISSDNPKDWKYKSCIAVGTQLFHNFSLSVSVDRDSNSGEALRGTVFTPDGRYLLIGCMGGSGGIAVIDVEQQKYLGKLTGGMTNVRHLVSKGDWIYASINSAGYVKRARLSDILQAISNLETTNYYNGPTWQSVKVAPGARTIAVSPMGDYIFAACNSQSRICIVDSSMNKIAEIAADSYPVGLDISPDGQWLISTSQGRKNSGGGNCVDIYSLTGIQGLPPVEEAIINEPEITEDNSQVNAEAPFPRKWIIGGTLALIALIILIIIRAKRKK